MTPRHAISLEFDPQLVEETVLLRIREDRQESEFYRSRDRLYLLPDGEEREKSFQELHAAWFVRLQLGSPITDALEEQPLLTGRARRCCVFPARSGQEEGADLHQWRAAKPRESAAGGSILIRVKVTRLLDTLRLQPWLRHELMHVADMLDPVFAYAPEWPAGTSDPAAKNILRERYRVLWDVWIDGRLERRGWLPEGDRARRFEEFVAAFPNFGPEAAERFAAIFDAETQTHAGLLRVALRAGGPGGPAPGPLPCPLCRFPTYELQAEGT
ncbi:MAG: hypothetical protein HY238_05935, partial [Acidobacteria bacterium]|nr:hypothetical protein [Acidobacteriota bacterium]